MMMLFKVGRFVLLITFLFGATVSGGSDDWLTYRHDNARTAKTNLDMPPPFIKVRTFPVGESVDCEPSIRGIYAYIGTNSLSCLNLSNGVTEWTIPADSKITTTPLALEDRVVYGTEMGTVACVDSSNSRTIWSITGLGKVVKGFCFDNELIYFTTTHGLIAAVKADGSFKYRISNRYPVSCAPTLYENKLFIGDDKGTIICYEAQTGKEIWRNERVSTDIIGGFNVSDGKLFFGCFDNYINSVYAATGKKIWSKRVDGWIQSPPVTIDKITYFQIRHTKLVGYDSETGFLKCEYEYQPSKSELLVSGKTLFVGSNRLVQAVTTCQLTDLWAYEFPNEQVTSLSMGYNHMLVGTSLGRIHQFKAGPMLGLSTKKIDKDVLTSDENPEFAFSIKNDRADSWETQLEGDITTNVDWLYVTEPLFTIENNFSQKVVVKILKQQLPTPGTYTGELVVSSNGGVYKIPITVHYIDPNPPKACFDATMVNMGAMQQGTLKKAKLTVKNCGKGTLRIKINTTSFGDWLVANRKSADIAEGASEEIILIAKGENLSSSAGDDCAYSGVLVVSTNVDLEPFSIPVVVRCYGIPIPTTINIKIGDPNVRINNNTVKFNPPSYIAQSRTMVPLRLVAEAFFASVEWYDDTRTIMINSCTSQTRFTIGSKIVELITKDGITEKEIDVPAEITNSRTFIPIRAVSDILGGKTSWNPETKTVTIVYEP
jgi:outer membrane protein assembly factor BamB